MRTIKDAIEAKPGNTSGFDYLRITLAFSVLASHSIVCSYGLTGENSARASELWLPVWWPLIRSITPSFFALSGFLIAGSLERNTLPAFLALRGLRIFPALAVEIVLSAIVIGTITTTLPLSAYFADPLFYRYFLNLIGDVHFYLPGVFNDLPLPDYVNVQLWTIPYEMRCYLIIAALFTVVRYPRIYFVGVFSSVAALTLWTVKTHALPPVRELPAGEGTMLVFSFLFGVALYLLRSFIPYNRLLFGGTLVLSWLLLQRSGTIYLATLPISYVTVFMGLQRPRRTIIIRSADYSYGVYLYGFPIQQLVALTFPQWRFASFNFAVSAPLALFCAWFSWTFIELFALSHKKVIVEFANAFSERLRKNIICRPRSS
jgi:peptidoglycan/LPS O-acetylase OafA/YrhL